MIPRPFSTASPLRHQASKPPAAVLALFGPVAEEQTAEEKTAEPVRETAMNLILKGIILRKGTDNRIALIADGTKREKIYRPGDRIDNAKVIRIDPRRVVLLSNGVYESLSLKREKFERPQSSQADNGSGSLVENDSSSLNVSIPRNLVKNQMGNLKDLLQDARAEPYSENGRQLGYRVMQMNEGSFFEEIGLKEDDVLRSINGLSVRNTREALVAYRKLKNADSLQLDLLRGGQDYTINYSIQ